MVVLDTLSPAERLAFVLHDMFAMPFDEIAALVDRSPTAARQLASRARRRVRGAAPPSDADLAHQRQIVEAFLAAARVGDFEALLGMLAPDVVLRFNGKPIRTGSDVARMAAANGPNFAPSCRIVLVNGAPGYVVETPDGRGGVTGFTVVGGRIAAVDVIRIR
jgi:RNA polymerase sigma-70 factor (ECF subfamily)